MADDSIAAAAGSDLWNVHNDCLGNRSSTSPLIRHMELAWAVICLAQAFFKLTQWPRSAWEGIYVPLCEAVQYTLLYFKLGYVSVGVNQDSHLPWVRYSFWMITTPVLLSQIQQITEVKIRGARMGPVQTWANITMVTLGISGALIENQVFKWLCFAMGTALGALIFFISFLIFRKALDQYSEIGHHKADQVVQCLRYLRICFFSSWSVFPILWIISAQGACVANEDVVSSIHIPADIIAKNVFGLLVWHIRFTLCDGYWDIERFKQRLLEDRLLEFFDDPDAFRQEHMMQAEACYTLADECLSNADHYLRRAAAIDQGMQILHGDSKHSVSRRDSLHPHKASSPHEFLSAFSNWWKIGRSNPGNRRPLSASRSDPSQSLAGPLQHGYLGGPRAYLKAPRSDSQRRNGARVEASVTRDSVRSGVWISSKGSSSSQSLALSSSPMSSRLSDFGASRRKRT